MNEDEITIKDRIIWFWLDLKEFLGNIEMRIKYLLNLKYFKSLSEKDIPNDTFYCYGGCRFNALGCSFMDYSKIAGSKYCHYIKGGIYDVCLYDSCKICDVNEFDDIETNKFEEALASLINNLWQDLTEEEKQQIKEILE